MSWFNWRFLGNSQTVLVLFCSIQRRFVIVWTLPTQRSVWVWVKAFVFTAVEVLILVPLLPVHGQTVWVFPCLLLPFVSRNCRMLLIANDCGYGSSAWLSMTPAKTKNTILGGISWQPSTILLWSSLMWSWTNTSFLYIIYRLWTTQVPACACVGCLSPNCMCVHLIHPFMLLMCSQLWLPMLPLGGDSERILCSSVLLKTVGTQCTEHSVQMNQSIVFMMHMCISMNMQQTCSKSSEGSASAEASILDHLNVKAHVVISRFCCVAFSEQNHSQRKSFFKISVYWKLIQWLKGQVPLHEGWSTYKLTPHKLSMERYVGVDAWERMAVSADLSHGRQILLTSKSRPAAQNTTNNITGVFAQW